MDERRDVDNRKTRDALDGVLEEREYQRNRWGTPHDQQHSRADWLTILTVYSGKIAENVTPYAASDDKESLRGFRKRLTQMAAICLAALEATGET
jgi:hypothetical protein